MFAGLLLMFISARGDTESDTVIQLTLEHVLVQIFKKKKWTKKITFNEDI